MDKCLCLPLQMVGACTCSRNVACVPVKQNIQKLHFSICYLALVAGTQIAQSRSIERFVANYIGFYPDDPVAAAHVDAVLDAIGDFWKAVMTSTAGVDKTSPEFLEKRKECAATGDQGLTN